MLQPSQVLRMISNAPRSAPPAAPPAARPAAPATLLAPRPASAQRGPQRAATGRAPLPRGYAEAGALRALEDALAARAAASAAQRDARAAAAAAERERCVRVCVCVVVVLMLMAMVVMSCTRAWGLRPCGDSCLNLDMILTKS